MGFGVGFLSGLFGVGGGFLLTPLLVFYGIPSGIAVATTLSHITASSVWGAIAQWRKRAIDSNMAGLTLACVAWAAPASGVWLFAVMRRAWTDGSGGLAVLCPASSGRGRRHHAECKSRHLAGGP